jgi:hypothetical protein
MNLFRRLLVLIMAAGMLEMADAAPLATTAGLAPMRTPSYSFADLYQLSTDARQAMLLAIAPAPAFDAIRAEAAAPAGAVAAQQAAAFVVRPVFRSDARSRASRDSMLLPVDAVPEPTGGVMLLSALLTMIFIARRRTQAGLD